MLIFDLDGTLYQTHETTLPALYETCEKYRLKVTPEEERFLLYTTTADLLERIAPEMSQDERARFYEAFKRREIALVRENGRLFDGVRIMLTDFFDRGIPMAICGMGSKDYIDTVLDRCGIRHYFNYVYPRIDGIGKAQRLRELLDEAGLPPERCIMIGDSITDLTAAKENGVPFVGVGYGYGGADIAGAYSIAQDAAELRGDINRALIHLHIENAIAGRERPLIIGINGVDTSGKTTFALGLERYLNYRGIETLLIHTDDFHNPLAVRRQDDSPQGYLNYTFDQDRIAGLLEEIKSGVIDRELTLLNLDTDTYTNIKRYRTSEKTVVILEGVLLFRPPIECLIDYKIFLDIGFDTVMLRAAQRDVPIYGDDFLRRYENRYIPAQKIYLEQYTPKQISDLIIDNNDYDRPLITGK